VAACRADGGLVGGGGRRMERGREGEI